MLVGGISLIGVIHLVLVVWMVWDLLESNRSCCSTGCWIYLLILFPIIGPIIYFIFGRSKKSGEP